MREGRPPGRWLAASTSVVVISMLALFLAPSSLFVLATFAATSVMALAAYLNGGVRGRIGAGALAAGVASAALLYLVFYLGNAGVSALNLPGANSSSERSIYALIASPSNPVPVQLAVLAFDAVGYETFFRGTLQDRLAPRVGVLAAPLVALFDAAIHLATFNLLWVGTTFVADLVWGLTYHYGRGLPASLTSHFLWDVAIFIVRPIV